MGSDHKGSASLAKPEDVIAGQMAWLRRLVTGLALTMMAGILVIAGLLWTKLSSPPLPLLPASVTLPDGAEASAVTFSNDRTIVVTTLGQVLVFRPDGSLVQTVEIQN